MMQDLISMLSEIRSQYNLFDETEWQYYHALSEAIRELSGRADGDTISRQAAIEAINTWDKFGVDERGRVVRWYEGLEPYVHLRDVVMAIGNLPTAQQWIPCSERLPEVGTYVLIYKKALSFRSNLPSVCTAHRSCDPRSGKEEWIDMLFGKLDDDDVFAWMPLPEPYEVERWEDGKTT